MNNMAGARSISTNENRWITDSRAYNLAWLGSWIERAQTIARVVRWVALQEISGGRPELETVLGMAAGVKVVTLGSDDTALNLLLTRDSSASLRGSLVAARFNATHVAPLKYSVLSVRQLNCLTMQRIRSRPHGRWWI